MRRDLYSKPLEEDLHEVASFYEKKGSSTTCLNNSLNQPSRKLNTSSSVRTLYPHEDSDFTALRNENEMLRGQISQLKELLGSQNQSKQEMKLLQQ